MVFNSFEYVIFLPVVFVIYWLVPSKFRWILLLISSYYFYMSWNPKYIILILGTTVVSYLTALLIDKSEKDLLRKLFMFFAIFISLGILFIFKYFNFFSNNIAILLSHLAIPVNPITLNLLLPVGISFYTFQTISYVIDVYNGKIHAEKHFGYYATFVSFFPQLVAGPIERTDNLLPQLKKDHFFDYANASYGLKLIIWGLFKKMCIADNLAIYVDLVYSNPRLYSGFDLLIVYLMFGLQIYCDFSGYSDIAIGSAKLLGINLMCNFRSPYFSSSIKEFWNRWHISLSSWFRDYLYIPLGGNRCSKFRHYFNLIFMFLISGLWHGANWTFIIWGGIHGILEVIENMLDKFLRPVRRNRIGHIFCIITIYLMCCAAWVFFRADSLPDATYILTHICCGITRPLSYFNNTLNIHSYELFKIILTIGLLCLFDLFNLKCDIIEYISSRKIYIKWPLYFTIGIVIFLYSHVGESSFIYFQF